MNKKIHLCDFPNCGKIYNHSWHLKRHKKVHSESRPEVCKLCNARFSKKYHLRKHLTIVHSHESDLSEADKLYLLHSKPYVCKLCAKSFPIEGKLKKHMQRHEQKPHLCCFEGCGEGFAFRKELTQHLKERHLPQCLICSKIFSSFQSLKLHIASVHDENRRLIPCSFEGCLKSFTKMSNLNNHIRKVHRKETYNSFCCRTCGKKFSYKSSMDRHCRQLCHETGGGGGDTTTTVVASIEALKGNVEKNNVSNSFLENPELIIKLKDDPIVAVMDLPLINEKGSSEPVNLTNIIEYGVAAEAEEEDNNEESLLPIKKRKLMLLEEPSEFSLTNMVDWKINI